MAAEQYSIVLNRPKEIETSKKSKGKVSLQNMCLLRGALLLLPLSSCLLVALTQKHSQRRQRGAARARQEGGLSRVESNLRYQWVCSYGK